MSFCISGYTGLGDSIYMRPFVVELARRHGRAFIQTPWPELYWDTKSVRVRRANCELRAQSKNEDATDPRLWHKMTRSEMRGEKHLRLDYSGITQNGLTITGTLRHVTGLNSDPLDWTMPLKPEWTERAKAALATLQDDRPVCLFRPPTVRKEWPCPSRNPNPDLFQAILDRWRDEVCFVAIGNCAEGEEWVDGDLSGWHHAWLNGELHWTTIMAMMPLVALVLGSPSSVLPMSLFTGARSFLVYGGYLCPERYYEDSMPRDGHSHVAPDPPCSCLQMNHQCNKHIPMQKVLDGFRRALSSSLERRTPGTGS